eukprot:scaffold85035_cov64-Cyclotella_meneghiniana.AAC.3
MSLTPSSSPNNIDSGSKTPGDPYLDLEQTPEILKNAATSFTSEVKKNIQSAAGFASSGFSSVATRGGSDVKDLEKNIKNAAQMATSGFSSVAKRGNKDVVTFTENAKKVAETSTGDLLRLAEQGILDLQSLSKNGTEKAGEVANWIEDQAKSGSKKVSNKAKSLVLEFTKKEEYTFGDITNELIRRIATKEFSIQDTILVIKLLVALGASIGPLAKVLPLTVLMEALNVSLEAKIGGKVLETLAASIDNRIVAAFSSDDKLQLGDAVKRTVLSGVLAFTGKANYESGDIQRMIEKSEQDTDHPFHLDLKMNAELQEWDRLFVEKCIESAKTPTSSDAKDLDIKISLALEECAKLEGKQMKIRKSIGATDDYFSQLGQ